MTTSGWKVVWHLKGCPRCGGDVFVVEDDSDDDYEQCLQCAWQRSLAGSSVAAMSDVPQLKVLFATNTLEITAAYLRGDLLEEPG